MYAEAIAPFKAFRSKAGDQLLNRTSCTPSTQKAARIAGVNKHLPGSAISYVMSCAKNEAIQVSLGHRGCSQKHKKADQRSGRRCQTPCRVGWRRRVFQFRTILWYQPARHEILNKVDAQFLRYAGGFAAKAGDDRSASVPRAVQTKQQAPAKGWSGWCFGFEPTRRKALRSGTVEPR